MKRNSKILISLFLIIIVSTIFSGIVRAGVEKLILQPEYSEAYKQWMKLTEQERAIVQMPQRYDTKYNIFNIGMKASSSSIPTRYDLRDHIINKNNIKIKSQGNTSACWAFAALSSLETNLSLKNQTKTYDYSERHMEYATSLTFKDGTNTKGFKREVGNGGNALIANAYLINGQGAVLESDMPFEDNENKINLSSINKKVATRVTDSLIFPSINSTDGAYIKQQKMNLVKNHIMNYGSVSAGIHGASIYSNYYNNSTGAIYCNNSVSCPIDHNVSIIGWDDNYSISNFNANCRPKNPGAWIIRNSWGESAKNPSTGEIVKIGDNGIMYVSYEDINIGQILYGIINAKDSVDYDYIYQHDEMGATGAIMLNANKAYLANDFTRDSSKKEMLTEIGIDLLQDTKCNIYVNPNGTSKNINNLVLVKKALNYTEAGYHTIELDNPIMLTGKSYTVVIETITSDNVTYIELETPVENTMFANVKNTKGVSYVTNDISSGEWLDTVDNPLKLDKGNICVKAFTKDITGLEISSNKYTIKENKYITKVDLNTTLSQFKNSISTKGQIKVYKNNKEVSNNEKLSTNMILKVNDVLEYKIAVKGDIDGDASLTIRDLSNMKLYIVGRVKLSEASAYGADISGDGNTNIIDLSRMKLELVK